MARKEADLRDVKSYQDLFDAVVPQIGGHASSRDEFRLLCEDLQVRMLIRISEEVVDFPDVVSGGFVTEWIQAESRRSSA
jgi:hypothetical protein